jgi:hypothetical protein
MLHNTCASHSCAHRHKAWALGIGFSNDFRQFTIPRSSYDLQDLVCIFGVHREDGFAFAGNVKWIKT